MKERSNENIDFWSACESYRGIMDDAERKLSATEIFERHISWEGPLLVNIDSIIRQAINEDLDLAKPDLFVRAQDHIYKLMKFDSFVRFQKSELYRKSFMAELDRQPLPTYSPRENQGIDSF